MFYLTLSVLFAGLALVLGIDILKPKDKEKIEIVIPSKLHLEDKDYIDRLFYREQPFNLTDAKRSINLKSGLAKTEGSATFEGNGEYTLSSHLKLESVLQYLAKEELIHHYQVKDEFVIQKNKDYREKLDLLKENYPLTYSKISPEVMEEEIREIGNREGNKSLGDFLLRRTKSKSNILDCYIQNFYFQVVGLDGNQDGILEADTPQDKPKVVVKLPNKNITDLGFDMLKNKGDVYILNVFGKVQVKFRNNQPLIEIWSYIIY